MTHEILKNYFFKTLSEKQLRTISHGKAPYSLTLRFQHFKKQKISQIC